MSRYLAYTSPARGHLYPIVATLLELRDRGHDVHVRTLASEVPALRAAGLHAEPIAAEIESVTLDDWKGSDPEEGLGIAYATFAARAEHEVPDVTRAIEDVDPSGLLIDVTTVGAAAVAEAGPIPWAMTIPLFQHFSFTPGVPRHLAMVPFEIAPPGLEVLNRPRRAVGLEPLTDADSCGARLSISTTRRLRSGPTARVAVDVPGGGAGDLGTTVRAAVLSRGGRASARPCHRFERDPVRCRPRQDCAGGSRRR